MFVQHTLLCSVITVTPGAIEVAGLVNFLAEPGSSHITGSNFTDRFKISWFSKF